MRRQGCILIVDDLETWREQITSALQRGGFQVEAVPTLAEGYARLHTNLYHILILDICMNENDLDNVDGIKLLQELYQQKATEAIKIIMLSAHETKEQMREAFHDYKVAHFLSKTQFNNQVILKAVKEALNDINLSLEIHWKESGAAEAVLDLTIGGNRVAGNSELQKQMAEELEDLLCRLFKDAKSVIVQPLIRGYSGAAVLSVQHFYQTKGAGRTVVVKFGDVKKIDQEHENFKNYVQHFLGGGRNTTVIDVRFTPHLGGIIYTFLGTSQDRLPNFGEFYRKKKLPQITKMLNRLFEDTCGSWYASRQGLQPVNLTDEYQHLLGHSAETLEHLPGVHGRQKLSFDALKDGQSFINPIRASKSKDRPFVYPSYLCITHGDFNPYNLLVDSNEHVWLIDFQRTGPSHILRDITMLDATIRFQLLSAEDVTLEECLLMEKVLCSIKRFSEVGQLPSKLATTNPALAKAYGTILHLYKLARKLVSQNPNDDMSEYYCALFYHALNTTRFATLSEGQREHALLCASLLADKLALSS